MVNQVVERNSFRWFPHAGQRHAVPNALFPLDAGDTLCGVPVEVPRLPLPKSPHWLWPECAACDTAWRRRAGLPQRVVAG